jgi:amino acid transporter
MEKHPEHGVSEETPRHEDVSTVIEANSLKRDLSSRHINMIAIAGMIVSLYIHTLIVS